MFRIADADNKLYVLRMEMHCHILSRSHIISAHFPVRDSHITITFHIKNLKGEKSKAAKLQNGSTSHNVVF